MELTPTQSLLTSVIVYMYVSLRKESLYSEYQFRQKQKDKEVMMLDQSKISELQCKDPLDSYSVKGKYLCSHYNDTIHNILIKIIHGQSHDMN